MTSARAWLFVPVLSVMLGLSAYADKVAQVPSGYFNLDGVNPAPVKVSVLSQPQVRQLFSELLRQDIPFQFAREGCYARSYAMTEYAKSKKIEMGQVVAEGSLQAETRSELYPTAQWGHHMAPMVAVDTGSGVELQVLDPALFDRPVSVTEWTKKLEHDTSDFNAQVTEVYYGTRFQYSPNDNEIHKSDRWRADRSNYRRDIAHFRAVEEELMGYQRDALKKLGGGKAGTN
jgi:hypothetical protein